MQVTFAGETYDCAVAIKGIDFVELYDANKQIIASFFDVTDFDAFSLSGGDWTPYVPVAALVRTATVSNGLITMNGFEEIETGTILRLRAPCDSATATQGLSIDGNVYTIVDAMQTPLGGEAGIWEEDSILAFLIDKVAQVAYLQSAGTGGGGGFVEMTTSIPVSEREEDYLYGLVLTDFTGTSKPEGALN